MGLSAEDVFEFEVFAVISVVFHDPKTKIQEIVMHITLRAMR
jgi:hypothetical protein